jgi:RNA polymerase sigma factor (sigma-70 family)
VQLPLPPSELDPALDARLVARCLAGEARAWDALVRRHERLVYAVARSWRLSDEDTADVFQEVFAALVRGLPRLRDSRSLVRWLSSTAERIARTTALRRRREDGMRAGDDTTLAELGSGDPPMGADLELLERQAMVRLALAGASERCRRLLAALYYEDPPPAYADLARRLGVPVGSLGPTRARCMEKLREALAALEGRGITAAEGSTFSRAGQRPARDRGASSGEPGHDGPTEENP